MAHVADEHKDPRIRATIGSVTKRIFMARNISQELHGANGFKGGVLRPKLLGEPLV